MKLQSEKNTKTTFLHDYCQKCFRIFLDTWEILESTWKILKHTRNIFENYFLKTKLKITPLYSQKMRSAFQQSDEQNEV